jgi:hypothetical protein
MVGNVGSVIGDTDGSLAANVGSQLRDPVISTVGEKVGIAELGTKGLCADGKELVVG